MTEKPVEMLKMRLQDSLFRELLRRIEDGEALPSDLNVARQLLKDVGVDVLLSEPASKRSMLTLAGKIPYADPEAVAE